MRKRAPTVRPLPTVEETEARPAATLAAGGECPLAFGRGVRVHHGLPVVAVGAMGGTIAMTPSSSTGRSVPGLGVFDLVDSVPGLSGIAELRTQNICSLPSPAIGIAHVLQALEFARQAVRDGASGVVITHGTDTLEETAYLLDLLWDESAPIVITGAMRPASAAGADGPANLFSAVVTASSPSARGLGVLACLNDTVHLASRVQKTSSMSVESFGSPGFGPVGRLIENEFRLLWGPPAERHAPLSAPSTHMIDVALLECAYADDGALVRLAAEAGFRGIVISAMGVGHVPEAVADAVSEVVDGGVVVVIGSRTAHGGTASRSYGYVGSETDLLRRGAIMAGTLSPRKARLLLHVLLSGGYEAQEIMARLEERSSS